MIHTVTEAIDYINGVNWIATKRGLERIRTLTDALGKPQDKLSYIHVAGTNGKGSTCAMLDSILRNAGYKVGLYTSPYINVFNERIRFDDNNISDGDLVAYTNRVKDIIESMTDKPTAFEIITAIAFCYFADKGCDIVVLETGMGGTWDATNIIHTPLCAVLTSIDYDHMQYLGNTIEEIVETKSGIIKGGNVVCYDMEKTRVDILQRKADETNATLTKADFSRLNNVRLSEYGATFDYKHRKNLRLSLTGAYQPYNACVALDVCDVLNQAGFTIPQSAVISGLEQASWCGRFEYLSHQPTFIIDGAHNPSGTSLACESLSNLYPNKKIIFICGSMADKDIPTMYAMLLPIASHFFTVTPHNIRAMKAQDLATCLQSMGANATYCTDFVDAVKKAFSVYHEGDVICALGSLYYSYDIRQAFTEVSSCLT